jgi:hypothetical protein
MSGLGSITQAGSHELTQLFELWTRSKAGGLSQMPLENDTQIYSFQGIIGFIGQIDGLMSLDVHTNQRRSESRQSENESYTTRLEDM